LQIQYDHCKYIYVVRVFSNHARLEFISRKLQRGKVHDLIQTGFTTTARTQEKIETEPALGVVPLAVLVVHCVVILF
jgi:hypothetical protein